MRAFPFMSEVSQRRPHTKSSRPRRLAVVSSTPRNNSADSRTSATSASDISSMRCIPLVAASAPAMAEFANSPPSRFNSAVASGTRRPTRESPQRRWWSRKERGVPTVKLCSHSDTFASSTVSGFLSTP